MAQEDMTQRIHIADADHVISAMTRGASEPMTLADFQEFLAEFPGFVEEVMYLSPERYRALFGTPTDEPKMCIPGRVAFGFAVWAEFHQRGNPNHIRDMINLFSGGGFPELRQVMIQRMQQRQSTV
jgi:hypothetical protein